MHKQSFLIARRKRRKIKVSSSSVSLYAAQPLHQNSLLEISGKKVGLHHFLSVLNWNRELLVQFKRVSIAHGRHLFRTTTPEDRKGQLKRQIEDSNAFGQVVQRLLTNVKWKFNVPLQQAPLQLGNSDLAEWQKLCDPCCAEMQSPFDVFKKACTCGHVTMKTYIAKYWYWKFDTGDGVQKRDDP